MFTAVRVEFFISMVPTAVAPLMPISHPMVAAPGAVGKLLQSMVVLPSLLDEGHEGFTEW